MSDEPKRMFVRALQGLNHRDDPTLHIVQLYERDSAHPNEQALVFGPDPVEVGDTPAVRVAIREGKIEEVPEGDFRAFQQQKQDLAAKAMAGDQRLVQQQAEDAAGSLAQIAEERRALDAERKALEDLRAQVEQQRAEFEQARKGAQQPARGR